MRNPRHSFLRIFAVLALMLSAVGAFIPAATAAPVSTDTPAQSAFQAELLTVDLCLDLEAAGVVDAEGLFIPSGEDGDQEALAELLLDFDLGAGVDLLGLAGLIIGGGCDPLLPVETGPEAGFLTVLVTDADGAPLTTATVTFDTIAEGGAVNPDGSFTTAATYEPGTYTFTVTAPGYEPASGAVTVVDGNASTPIALALVVDEVAENVTFAIVADDETVPAGAGLTITGPAGVVLEDVVPADGIVAFPELTPGTYTVVVSATEDYSGGEGTFEIAATDDGATFTVTVVADDSTENPIEDNAANVSFQVVGLNGEVPVGATLVITGATAGEVFNATVPVGGVVTLPSLVPDDYQVTVGPVEGFEGTTTTFTIGADDDDETFTVTVGITAGEDTGVVTVSKYECVGIDETIFGGSPDDNCVPGEGVFTFYLVGDGTDDNWQLTVGATGVAQIELAEGTYEVVEEGSQARGEVEVVAGQIVTLTVLNPGVAPVETGFVEVTKYFCPDLGSISFNGPIGDDCTTGPATFSFYLIGDDSAEFQQLQVWEDGFGVIELPVGEYEVVEEGWQASTIIEVTEGETTVLTVANPGNAPAPREGTVNVSAFVCENIEAPVWTSDGFVAIFAELPTFEPACEPTTTTMTFYAVDDNGDDVDELTGLPTNALASVGMGSQDMVGAFQAADGVELLVEGTASISLAPGNYLVEDQTTGATTVITVFAGDFISLDLQIPAGGEVVPGSSVNVVKFYCDTVTETEFLALTAAEYSERDELDDAPDCVSGEATFTFYLYGDGTADYAQLTVNGSGSIGLAEGRYEVVEEETGASFTLEVVDGENVVLLVNNPMPEDGEVPGGPDDDGDDDGDNGSSDDGDNGDDDGVTGLPSTGSGMTDGAGMLTIAAAAAAAISGAGALAIRKER